MRIADAHSQKRPCAYAAQLITMHNIRFSQRLMAGVRQAIAEDRLMDFRNECIAKGMFD